ncbi:MAG: mercuric transporter MerT family protein [Gemmatimonadota bacterium]|jgi:mercuric ion transport protein
MKGILISGMAGLAAAFGSAVCCSGPLVLASFGLSGAALSTWRPYRPVFVLISVGLLWLAFRLQSDAHTASCAERAEQGGAGRACSCADPSRMRRTRTALIVLAALSFLLLVSPRWVPLVF